MERLFQILAVILAGVAAFFFWRGNWDAGFVSAVFGAVCFFLSIRFQVRERLKIREAEREAEYLAAQDAETREKSE
jgi:pilus assembly protein TadC